MARLRPALIRAAAVILILLLLGGVAIWTGVQGIAPRTSLSDVLAPFRGPTTGSLSWKVEHHQRVNLLLMARGGAGADNPNFTDTMVVVSMRPPSQEAILISLPRFAWVPIPALTSGEVSGKLYSAYALAVHPDNASLRPAWRTTTGAGDLAAATIAQLIGLPIDGWVVIDINGFRDVVDALGGITVSVPRALDDPAYPVDDIDRTTHIYIAAGTQRLDGEHALEYARSRRSTSETDRSERQQLLLTAIATRLHHLSVGPSLLFLLGALQGRLLTNLHPSDARQLAAAVDHVSATQIHRLTVDESNFVYAQPEPGGDEVLMPRDGSYAGLRRYISALLAGQS